MAPAVKGPLLLLPLAGAHANEGPLNQDLNASGAGPVARLNITGGTAAALARQSAN
jgi:hypothetical protein